MASRLASARCGDVHRRKLVQVRADDAVGTVVGLMRERASGAVLITEEDGTLVGIFTERDVLARSQHKANWKQTPVGDLMTRNPVCVGHDEPIWRALHLMERGGFRRLAQVDHDGRAVGILSVRDILVFMAENFPEEFVNLPPDPTREARERWGG